MHLDHYLSRENIGRLASVVAVVVWLLMIWGGLILLRWFKRWARTGQEKAFEGVDWSNEPAKGKVKVGFHTYSGFLVFVLQTEHRFWAEPDQARLILWRLHRYNCTRGLFAYGALVIPLLSWGNYLGQKVSIGKQVKHGLSPEI